MVVEVGFKPRQSNLGMCDLIPLCFESWSNCRVKTSVFPKSTKEVLWTQAVSEKWGIYSQEADG